LTSGGSAAQMEAILLSSPEYLQVRGGGTDNGFLAAVYHDVLGRAIDPSGAQGWGRQLARLHSGPTAIFAQGAVVAGILGSPEGRLHQVQDLYPHFLHRPIDPSGLVAWVGTLPRALPKEAITAGLLASAEYFIKSQNADPRAALHVTPILEVGQAIQTQV